MSQEQAAALLAEATAIVAVTGAGISTESGLPDFRSPGGVWAQYDPMEVATVTAFRTAPQRFYDFYQTRLAQLAAAQPNPAHHALAHLEQCGPLRAVVTQNVDGLHQAAGSRRVIELHGNLREAACLDCGWIGPISVLTSALDQGLLPHCARCRGPLKPNIVLFEEVLPAAAYQDAETACQQADVVLVVGSSLQVTPAAWLPEVARRHGAALVIVNEEPTPLDRLATVVLRGRAGAVLPAVVSQSEARRRNRDSSG